MTLLEKKIKLEVHGKNEFARIVIAELNNIMPQLQKFIGKKIFTLQGVAKIFVVNLVKIAPLAYQDGSAQNQGCYFVSEYGTLRLKCRAYFNTFGITEYVERTIELGDLSEDNVLLTLNSVENILSDYGFDVVLNEAEQIEKVQEYIRVKAENDEKLNALSGGIKVSYDLYRNA